MNLQQPVLTSARVMADGRIMTPWFRGSFMNIWTFEKPMNQSEQPSTYSIQMLFDPEKVNLDVMRSAAHAAAKEAFGANLEKYIKTSSWMNPFRKGDEKPDYDGYEGKIFVRASTRFSVSVADPAGRIIIAPAPNEPDPVYSGAYYRATVLPKAFDFNGKRGVKFYLSTLQKLADGEPFGGMGSADAASDYAEALEGADTSPPGDHSLFNPEGEGFL